MAVELFLDNLPWHDAREDTDVGVVGSLAVLLAAEWPDAGGLQARASSGPSDGFEAGRIARSLSRRRMCGRMSVCSRRTCPC